MVRRTIRSWLAALAVACAVPPSAARAASGDTDPSFAGGTTVQTAIPGSTHAAARAIVELAGGRLLVAGTAGGPGGSALALARYRDDGTLDPTFGGGGIVRPDLGVAIAPGPVALVRRTDGILIVAATALDAGSGDFLVARLDAGGMPDPTFAVGGKRIVDLGGDERVAALALDGAQRPVVVGRGGATGQVAVLRLDGSGAPDAAFSGDGIVTTDVSGAGRPSAAHDVALAADGDIVVVGEVGNGTDLDVAVVRYDDGGTPDAGFGDDGVVVTALGTEPFSTNDDVARGVVVQPDGKIVAAGWRHARGFFHVVLLRYDHAGVLDPHFGAGGVAVAGDGFGEGVTANALVREPDGHLVTTGRYVSNQIISVGFPALTRFTPAGVLDAGFAGGGVAVTGRAGHLFALDDSFAVLRDAHARYVIAGVAQDFPPSSASTFAVARVLGPDPASGACASGPRAGCRRSLRPERSLLSLLVPPTGASRLLWQWRAGAATTRNDFGDPPAGDGYTLCAFDGSGTELVAATVASGGCARPPCWRQRGDGYVYRDESGTGGIRSVRLRPGSDGAALIEVGGRGATLGLPALPLVTPVTVQLLGSQGVCWEAIYDAPVARNAPPRFRARATH